MVVAGSQVARMPEPIPAATAMMMILRSMSVDLLDI
jgi:hypothetical protein